MCHTQLTTIVVSLLLASKTYNKLLNSWQGLCQQLSRSEGGSFRSLNFREAAIIFPISLEDVIKFGREICMEITRRRTDVLGVAMGKASFYNRFIQS